MRLTLLAVGYTDSPALKSLTAEYGKRLQRFADFCIEELPDVKNARNLSEVEQKIREGRELLARIRAMTRKHAGQRTNRFTAGDLVLDAETRRVTRGGEELTLLPKEFSVLEYLLRNKEKVLSREQIENRIWNYEYSGSSNNVDGYMSRLRRKIDGDRVQKLIHTVKGAGWVIREPQSGGNGQ